MHKIHGKVVAITGGARGIGYAIAKRLIADGASVAIGDIDDVQLKQAAAEFRASPRTPTWTSPIRHRLQPSSTASNATSGCWTSSSTTRASCRSAISIYRPTMRRVGWWRSTCLVRCTDHDSP